MSFQPFPITEFKTGMYQYLEPWIRPSEAFEPMEDAYIYRGALFKRNGTVILGNQALPGAGRMFYKDYSAVGNGTATYSFTLGSAPIIPGTLAVTADTKTATDDGNGSFTGDVALPGSIDYSTGAVTVVFDANIASTVGIYSKYSPSHFDYLSKGNDTPGPYSLTTKTNPVTSSSVTIYAGTQSVYDNGGGALQGDGTGTIDYITGAISVTFNEDVSSSTWIYALYNDGFGQPIMGIKTWINAADGTSKLLVFDTRRVCFLNEGTQLLEPINSVSEQIGKGNGGGGAYAFNAGFTNIAPGSFTLTDGTETFTSNFAQPEGDLTNGSTGTGKINWATGAFTVTFSSGTSANFQLTYTLAGNYFTGDYTNFFNATNWKPTTVSYLYCTNNHDRVTLYNGTNLSRPPLAITQTNADAYVNQINTCIDIDVYKNRLLLHRPTTSNVVENQTIRYSAQFNATNFVADVAGNGGALVFPTQDFIQGGEFLRDQMVVFFRNSIWLMQPTQFSVRPFIATQVNSTRSTNCPYAMIPYDQRVTSIGSKGIIACDGVNTSRFDVNIVDQFLQIDPQAYNQCFSQRFDNINQSWTLYPSLSQIKSDKILVYNYLENTWCVFNIPLSCLGLYRVVKDQNWDYFADNGSNPLTWDEAQFVWDAYLLQKPDADLLGGDHVGNVYILDYGEPTDNGTPYNCNITSTLWNPFVKEGKAVNFGYIDIYYKCNDAVHLKINFYANGSEEVAATRNITLSQSEVISTEAQLTNFQRVYINLSAQFLQMEITSDTPSTGIFQINGFILWAKSGSRITPAKTII